MFSSPEASAAFTAEWKRVGGLSRSPSGTLVLSLLCPHLFSFHFSVGMDISADLMELGRTPVAVVCAGVKSILDIPRTLEFLVRTSEVQGEMTERHTRREQHTQARVRTRWRARKGSDERSRTILYKVHVEYVAVLLFTFPLWLFGSRLTSRKPTVCQPLAISLLDSRPSSRRTVVTMHMCNWILLKRWLQS
jgi:Indigoidine synthase A like protein